MADIRFKDLDEAAVPGSDYWIPSDSATDGVKKIKPSNLVTPADIGAASLTGTETLTNKTLTAPALGAATATSVNKVTITAPATGATLTIDDGKTLTASDNATVSGTNTGDQTITLTGDVTGSGTGSFAATIGATKVTSAMLNSDVFSTAHSWSGTQTFTAPALGTPASGVATNLTGTAAGLTAGTVTTNANLTGDVTSVGNATTLTNAPVIAKVLTGFTSGAGTLSASDSILSAIQKLDGNIAGSVSGVSSLNGQTGALKFIALPQNRLTLTSGTAITTVDVATATSVYLSAGQSITSDGTNLIPDSAAELTLALDSTSAHTGYHQSGKNFDVFRINDSGTIRIGTGPAWSSDTARGSGAGTTEIHQFGNTGVWTNANTITIRFGSASGNTVSIAADQAVYLGSFRATADGQTEDSKAKRFLYNAFNPAMRALVRNDATVSWTLSGSGSPGATGYSLANGSSSNKVEVLNGLGGTGIRLEVSGQYAGDGATGREIMVGIGLGSSTTSSHTTSTEILAISANGRMSPRATYEGYLALGYQDFRWLEQNFSGAGSPTSYGTSTDGRMKTGMAGEIWQ